MHQLFSRFFIQRQHFVPSGPSFFDLQPCGAEKTQFFLTCNLAAQKIPRRYCQLTFLATVEKHFRGGCTFVVAKRKIRKQRVSADF